MLPQHVPHSNPVGDDVRKWRKTGVLPRLNDQLRRRVRWQKGRTPEPSGGIMDRQSAKSADRVGTAVGYDGGTPVHGRKRHILVGPLGVLLAVVVMAANCSDQCGARQVCQIARPRCPRLRYVAADRASGSR